MSLRALLLGGAAALAAACAAGAADWKQPKTPWGDPDLQGTWPLQHLSTVVPLQRGFVRNEGERFVFDDKYGDRLFKTDEEMAASSQVRRAGQYEAEESANKLGMGHWTEIGKPNARTSLIVDPPNGRLPEMTEEGKRRSALMRSGWMLASGGYPGGDIDFDWVTDFDNWDRCITRSLPATMLPSFYNTGVRIWQAPGYVAIQTEMIHEVRIVPLDGRPAPDGKVKQWLGEPRGHWEGDTLVVVSKNFNGQGSSTNIHTVGAPPFNNTPQSTDYTFTETFTRTGPDTLTYRATIDDPVVWTKPWTVELPWVRDDGYELYEYACHEGNQIVPGYISSSRAKRAQEAAARKGE